METIRAYEIIRVLKEQIKNFNKSIEINETGTVLAVGDGVARVYGLQNVQSGEMVEFANGIRGMALNKIRWVLLFSVKIKILKRAILLKEQKP